MIELISRDRCIHCNACVDACPDDVFATQADGVPIMARQEDCQTCFLCELYCPVDAIYVSPLKEQREVVDEAELIRLGRLGSYRRALGWRGIKSANTQSDLSYRLPEADGTPWDD